jgi:hypothetical protein
MTCLFLGFYGRVERVPQELEHLLVATNDSGGTRRGGIRLLRGICRILQKTSKSRLIAPAVEVTVPEISSMLQRCVNAGRERAAASPRTRDCPLL